MKNKIVDVDDINNDKNIYYVCIRHLIDVTQPIIIKVEKKSMILWLE